MNSENKVILKEFPDYEIYENGDVFSNITDKKISPHERNGFIYFSIVKVIEKERKRVSIGQHQLLALAFIPNPENLLIVGHKDGDGFNNSLNNLEWSDRKKINRSAVERKKDKISNKPVLQYSKDGELMKKFESIKDAADEIGCHHSAISKICTNKKGLTGGFNWRFEGEIDEEKKEDEIDEETEKWKFYGEKEKYEISSKGRIHSLKTDIIMRAADRKDGYQRIRLNKKYYYVHRLVASVFLGPPSENLLNPVVNHKDGDKSNNSVDNLEWIEQSANVSHACSTGLHTQTKPVLKYSLGGELLGRYSSSAEAAREYKVSHTSINSVCRKDHIANKTSCGFIWRYECDPLEEGEAKNIKGSKHCVVQYSMNCEKIKEYSGVGEAAKEIGVHPSSISNVCRKKTVTSGGFIWRYSYDSPPDKVAKTQKKRIIQLSKLDEMIKEFDSITDAAKELNINNSHISSVCNGKRNTTGGWKFKYIE